MTQKRKSWSDTLTERVAGAVRSARGNRSAQEVADETARLGHPMTRSQIANLESGRKRSLDIAELLVIAAALRTSPVALLYPGPYDHEIEVLPDKFATELEAAEWFSGLARHAFTDSADDPRQSAQLREEYRRNLQQLQNWRQLEDLYSRRSAIVIPKGGEINEERRQLIEYYENDIKRLRFELGIDNDDA